MTAAWHLALALPFATASAVAFYALLAACVWRPNVREWLLVKAAMPVPSSQSHLAPLDAYRGLAAFLIAITHSWQFTYPVFATTQAEWAPFMAYAAKAVPIFTVLSGFLIYRSVKRVETLAEIKRYGQRRFLRIYPAYLLAAVLCILIGQTPWTVPHIIGEILGLKVFNFPWFTNRPAWSLYVEALFYLVLPMLVLLAGRRILLAAALAFAAFALTDSLASSAPSEGSTPLEFHIYMHGYKLWKYFAAGIIAAEFFDRFRGRVSEAGAIAIFTLGAGLLILDFTGPRGDWFASLGLVPADAAGYTIGLALACALVILGSCWSASVVRLWTALPPLRVLGVVSYSLFLLHPIYLWVNFPSLDFYRMHLPQPFLQAYPRAPAWYLPLIIMPGEVFWAIAAFIMVERPFLFRGGREALRPSGDKRHRPSNDRGELEKA